MNKITRSSIVAVFVLFVALTPSIAFAQTYDKFTPYENLPTSQPILKPDFNEQMPEWGKMLYQYPINFYEITNLYNTWEAQELKRTGMSKVRNPLVRYYKIWRQSVEPYVLFDGAIEMPDVNQVFATLRRNQVESSKKMMRSPAAGNSSSWSWVGPKNTVWTDKTSTSAPWQVNVYCLDVSLTDPNTLYIGTETGFVNKTIDNGVTWNQSGRDYVFGGAVTAVAISGATPDTAFVAAGNTVHRTTDGGTTWNPTAASFGTNRLKTDYSKPGKYMAAAGNGVWYTRNGGVNWLRGSGITTEVYDVVLNPSNSDTIYALTKNATTGKYKMMQSSNGGISYLNMNFPDTLQVQTGGLLAVTPADPNAVYAFLLTNNMNGRPFVYKGTVVNNAWSWEKLFTGSDASFTSNSLNNGQGYFDIVFGVSPINKNIIFAGTCSVMKSTNGGKTFAAVGGYAGPFSIHPDAQDLKFLPDGKLWISTDGGMNYSTDAFVNASKYRPSFDGIVGSDFWGFDQGWNEDIMVGGRYHNGNTVITDFYGYNKALRMGGGESPTGWVVKGKSRYVAFDDLGDGYILPSKLGGAWEGRFVFSKYPNMDGYGGNRSNIATHPHYSGTLYVGSDNSIWISTDFGVSYSLLNTFSGRVRYLNVATSNPNVMYCDVVGQGIYKTEDGGVTWTKKSQPTSWGGNVAFVISPYNADYVYACMQTGSNNGDVYRTTNGGTSWTKWSNFNTSTKSITIQPTNDGKDLVYLFTTSNGGNLAKVYIRKDGDAAWTEFDTNYPRGLRVNIALPFYHDSKMRVSGNAGVWETPLAEPDFEPIIIPWVEKKTYECTNDTIKFDSHSLLNQEGVTWAWEITPAPKYISATNVRNPKAVFENTGDYTVKLTVTKNGKEYSATVNDMFKIKQCPSIFTCDNPGEMPKKEMKLISVDSYESGNEGAKAFDGNLSTLWHTNWSGASPSHPHNIQIDFTKEYNVSSMTYYPRTDGANGRIKAYELYLSKDKTNWGAAVATGNFENISSPQKISFPATTARYVKLVALSEVNGNVWASAAELTFVGCLGDDTGVKDVISGESLRTFPLPAASVVNIELPFQNGLNTYTYAVYSANGTIVGNGEADETQKSIAIDLRNYAGGYYFVRIQDKSGVIYRVKFVKQ